MGVIQAVWVPEHVAAFERGLRGNVQALAQYLESGEQLRFAALGTHRLQFTQKDAAHAVKTAAAEAAAGVSHLTRACPSPSGAHACRASRTPGGRCETM